MAKNKKSVLIYVDWIATFNKLEDDEAGRLIKHFFSYVNDLNPVSDRLTELLFEPIKQQLKRDLKAYEQTCQRNSKRCQVIIVTLQVKPKQIQFEIWLMGGLNNGSAYSKSESK